MVTDILKIIKVAGFVAVPALAAFIPLDWYFTRDGKSTRTIFITVAGLLSAILYSYFVWTEPAVILIFVSIWVYLGLSALAVVIYYALYTVYNGKADSPARAWLLPTALLTYVALFCAIGVFCAAVLARHDYWRLGGHVFADSRPLPGVTLILLDGNLSEVAQSMTSDGCGRFLFALKYDEYEKKPDAEKPAHLLVKTTNYGEQTFDDFRWPHPSEDVVISFQRGYIPH